MTTNPEYRHRITVDLTAEQHNRIREVIPWGYMNKAFNVLIDDLIEIMETGGEIALAALLARRLKLGHFLKDKDGNLVIDKIKESVSAAEFAKLDGSSKNEG